VIKKTLIFLILFISSLKAESVFPIDPAINYGKLENDRLNSKHVGLRISTIDENNIWLRYNNPKIKIKIKKNPLKNSFYNFHFKQMLSAKVF